MIQRTLLFGAVLVALGACQRHSAEPVAPPAAVTSVSPMEAYGLLRNDFAVLVDVREKDEVDEGMAAPAKWIPTSKIEANDPSWQEFVKALPKNKQIIFYCAGGGRAGQAAEKLAQLGFKTSNLGGYDDWVRAKLPTKKP